LQEEQEALLMEQQRNEVQEALKEDLRSLDPKLFYLKHIVKSNNWYFAEYLKIPTDELIDKMDYFKEIVSSNLNISFHSLQIVGSAKIGYSLSPQKLFKPFHDGTQQESSSDIDIAVVSERLYQKYWDKLRSVRGLWNQYYYDQLTKSIFRGYINDKDLMKINGIREEWTEITSPINMALQDNLGFVHPITYRIYRYWDDLEDYQLYGISKAKKKLEGE